jgi:type IV pilus assembly protein PilA
MLNALRKRMQDDKGFTLIELMVVVLIIAILIAIAIPTFLGLRERAQDRGAQSNLRNALTAAKAFYTDGETYAGFNMDDGALIEPSLTWNDDVPPATEGEVSVRVAASAADGDDVLLATQSASGTFFCIADNDGITGYASADAAAVGACAGTSW